MRFLAQFISSARIILLPIVQCMVEKALLWGKIFEKEILMDLQVLRFPKSQNHILVVGLSVYSVCLLPTKLEEKRKKEKESSNSKFGILDLYHEQMLFETFKNIGKIVCIQRHTKEFVNIIAYRRNILLMHFIVFRLH